MILAGETQSIEHNHLGSAFEFAAEEGEQFNML